MKIRLIAEGSTKKDRKTLRWGLAFLIDDVLFDAFGREDIFWENAHRRRIDLSHVHNVVISHDDWDHTAALGSLLRTQPKTKVFLCKNTPKKLRAEVRANSGTIIAVSKSRRVKGNIFSLGQMRADTGRGILYEQALVIKSSKGFSVITGCAHPGIVHIVKQAVKIFGKKIRTVCGGFHMKDNTLQENRKIVEAFRALGVKKVIPLHCTGQSAARLFRRLYGKACCTPGKKGEIYL